MKIFFHLLRRELRGYRLFFVAALAVGFLPYSIAPLAAAHPNEIAGLRTDVARFVVLGFFLFSSCVLGARWLTAGFASGERAFELARPISAGQLCASKLSAILLLIFGGTWLASLPTFLTAFRFNRMALDSAIHDYVGNEPFASWTYYRYLGEHTSLGFGWVSGTTVLIAAVVAAALILLALTQTIALAFAARSARSLADLAAFLVFFGLLALALERLRLYGALGIGLTWLVPLGLLWGGLGIWSAWRTFGGGALLGAAHRRHSLAMNSGLVLLGALTALSAHASTRPNIGRLDTFSIAVPSPDLSRWIVSGSQDPRGFEPAFLVDRAKGEARYLMPRREFAEMPLFSPSGDRLFSFAYESGVSFQIRELADLSLTDIPLTAGAADLGSVAIDPERKLLVSVSPTGELRVHWLSEPGRAPFRLKNPELRGMPTLVVHRLGSRFDLVVFRTDHVEEPAKRIWTVRRYSFDAATSELLPLESWTYPQGFWPPGANGSRWWDEALPLAEAGVPFSQLAGSRRLVALEAGGGVMEVTETVQAADETARWQIFNRTGEPLGSFEAPREMLAVGEIRPGLLLVSHYPSYGIPHHLGFWLAWLQDGNDRFRTLVVELPSGRILRELQGFSAIKYPQAGKAVWLIDKDGVPYDLPAADAEPQPILPFRPEGLAARLLAP